MSAAEIDIGARGGEQAIADGTATTGRAFVERPLDIFGGSDERPQLQVDYLMFPGEIDLLISSWLTGAFEEEAFRNIFGQTEDNAKITVSLSVTDRFRQFMDSQLSRLQRSANLINQEIPSGAQQVSETIQQRFGPAREIVYQAKAEADERQEDYPFQTNETFEFDPIRVPVPDIVDEPGGRLPPLQLTVRAEPLGEVEKAFFGLDPSQGLPEVTIDVPAEVFVNFTSVDRIPCSEAFSSVDRDIDRLNSSLNRVESDVNELVNRGLNALSRAGEPGRAEEDPNVQGPDEGQPDQGGAGEGTLTRGAQDEGATGGGGGSDDDDDDDGGGGATTGGDDDDDAGDDGLENTPGGAGGRVRLDGGGIVDAELVEQMQSTASRLQGLSSQAVSIQNRVSNVQRTDCADQFTQRLDRIKDDVQDLQDDLNDIIRQLGGRVRLPCSESFSGLYTQAQQLSDTVSSIRELQFRDIQNFRDEASTLRSTIINQTQGRGECREELLSIVDNVRSQISQRARTLPCGQKYPDIEEQIERVRSQIATPGTISPSDVQGFRSNVDTVINDINRQVSGDNRCINELRDQAQSLRSEVTQLAASSQCRNEYSTIFNSIDQLKDDVSGYDPTQADTREQALQELRNFEERIGRLQNSVDNVVESGSECGSRFRDSLTQLTIQLNSKRTTASQLEQARVNCSEEFGDIVSDIEDLESSINDLAESRPTPSNKSTMESLVSDAQSLVNTIGNDIPSDNPCQGQLSSRVRSAISLSQNFIRQDTAAPRCGNKYPQLNGRIERFQQTILDTSTPVDPSSLANLTKEGRDITNAIKNNLSEGDRCRSTFLNDVRDSLERLNRLTEEEIRVGAASSIQEERKQRREELEGILQEVEAAEAPGGGVSDFNL